MNANGWYNRLLRVYLFNIRLAQVLAIPSGFGRSRIRRNCGYTLLATVFSFTYLENTLA